MVASHCHAIKQQQKYKTCGYKLNICQRRKQEWHGKFVNINQMAGSKTQLMNIK
jgi:hypothetical protein